MRGINNLRTLRKPLESAFRVTKQFSSAPAKNMKILCVLYEDPIGGQPTSYARNDLPSIDCYPNKQTLPSPKSIDFIPGTLLGSVSGELGLRPFLESLGHTLIVTSDKEGPNSVFDKHLVDADVVISQPFYPAYLTPARIASAKNLKLAITAGIGSDHVNLTAANEHGIAVAEVTFSNSISVAEHIVMMILSQVRNYLPSYEIAKSGGWNIADCVMRSYDVEGMNVGTVAAGRIGLAVLRRMQPFDVKLHYTDKYRLSPEIERELNLTYHASAAAMVPFCDVVTINCPLHPETENMFDDKLIATMKKGAYLINTARANICERDSIVRALESGQLAGYAGDVWCVNAYVTHVFTIIPWAFSFHHWSTCLILSSLLPLILVGIPSHRQQIIPGERCHIME